MPWVTHRNTGSNALEILVGQDVLNRTAPPGIGLLGSVEIGVSRGTRSLPTDLIHPPTSDCRRSVVVSAPTAA